MVSYQNDVCFLNSCTQESGYSDERMFLILFGIYVESDLECAIMLGEVWQNVAISVGGIMHTSSHMQVHPLSANLSRHIRTPSAASSITVRPKAGFETW